MYLCLYCCCKTLSNRTYLTLTLITLCSLQYMSEDEESGYEDCAEPVMPRWVDPKGQHCEYSIYHSSLMPPTLHYCPMLNW